MRSPQLVQPYSNAINSSTLVLLLVYSRLGLISAIAPFSSFNRIDRRDRILLIYLSPPILVADC
ncbi:hypothetical protein [Nostoc sp. NOS(2021)]|uniref:hypothetical protein n=1 Tax=Nostoc sp. NOS(2021) TaxID=2815407 RepID=UPI0025D5D13E|nr:hypothetical protein [Nostoc sp. NOS(2021)]